MHELFYLNQLSPSQARLYCQMLESIQRGNRSSRFYLSLSNIASGLEDSFLAYCALRNDRPEYFFLGTEVHRQQHGANLELWATPTYYPDQIPRIERQLERFLDRLCRFPDSLPQWEIERKVYEQLCTMLTYQDSGSDYEHDIVGPVLKNVGVCEGISNIFILAMRRYDIPCIRIDGIGKDEGHTWNIVWINNTPCHVDLTWEDVCAGHVGYFFFNRPSSAVAIDHKWDCSLYPACNSAAYSIIDRNGISFDRANEAEYAIKNAFCAGETAVRFRCNNPKGTAKRAINAAPPGRYLYSVNEDQSCGIIVKS